MYMYLLHIRQTGRGRRALSKLYTCMHMCTMYVHVCTYIVHSTQERCKVEGCDETRVGDRSHRGWEAGNYRVHALYWASHKEGRKEAAAQLWVSHINTILILQTFSPSADPLYTHFVGRKNLC